MNGWLVEEDNNKNVYEGTKNKRFTFISFYSEIEDGEGFNHKSRHILSIFPKTEPKLLNEKKRVK